MIDGHLCAWRGLDAHFRFSVAVKVIDHELGVVSPGADVRPHVQTPQQPPIQLIAVDDAVARIAPVGNVVGIGGVPFDKVFHFAVAVHVADGHVIGAVGERLALRVHGAGTGHAVRGLLQRNVQIRLVPGTNRRAFFAFFSLINRSHLIFRVLVPVPVKEIGAVCHISNGPSVPVHGKVRAGQAGVAVSVHFVFEQTPGQEHALLLRYGDQPPIQLFQLGMEHFFDRRFQAFACFDHLTVRHRFHIEIVGNMGGFVQVELGILCFGQAFIRHALGVPVRPVNPISFRIRYIRPADGHISVRQLQNL